MRTYAIFSVDAEAAKQSFYFMKVVTIEDTEEYPATEQRAIRCTAAEDGIYIAVPLWDDDVNYYLNPQPYVLETRHDITPTYLPNWDNSSDNAD